MRVLIPTNRQAKRWLSAESYAKFVRISSWTGVGSRLRSGMIVGRRFRGKTRDGEDVLVLTTPEGKGLRRKQLDFWKRHNNTYLTFRSSAACAAAGFRSVGATEHGGKFDALIVIVGAWCHGIKEERVKKGGKAA